jgi:hypothetical protein
MRKIEIHWWWTPLSGREKSNSNAGREASDLRNLSFCSNEAGVDDQERRNVSDNVQQKTAGEEKVYMVLEPGSPGGIRSDHCDPTKTEKQEVREQYTLFPVRSV